MNNATVTILKTIKSFQKQLAIAGVFYYFSQTSSHIPFLFNFGTSVVDLSVQVNEIFSTQLLTRHFILEQTCPFPSGLNVTCEALSFDFLLFRCCQQQLSLFKNIVLHSFKYHSFFTGWLKNWQKEKHYRRHSKGRICFGRPVAAYPKYIAVSLRYGTKHTEKVNKM